VLANESYLIDMLTPRPSKLYWPVPKFKILENTLRKSVVWDWKPT